MYCIFRVQTTNNMHKYIKMQSTIKKHNLKKALRLQPEPLALEERRNQVTMWGWASYQGMVSHLSPVTTIMFFNKQNNHCPKCN